MEGDLELSEEEIEAILESGTWEDELWIKEKAEELLRDL